MPKPKTKLTPEAVHAGAAKPKVVKRAAKTTAKPASNVAYPIPDFCPYRHADGKPSGYAMVWAILYAHRDTGISKSDLTARYRAWCRKPWKRCGFDVHIVTTPREDGSCHRSAAKAAQHYWVERECSWLKLHLLSEKK
jgi:hypothetical protein